MICSKCENQMSEGANFCNKCGYSISMRNKLKKIISNKTYIAIASIVVVLLISVAFIFLLPSNKNVIKRDSVGMYYLDADGDKVYNNWFKYKDNYYHTNHNGYIETNKWVDNDYYVGDNGIMCTDQWIQGTSGHKQYYVDSSGKYVRDRLVTIAGKDYYFLSDGNFVFNRLFSVTGNSWTSYFDANGAMVKAGDFVDIGVNIVYIDKNGRIVSNDWVEKNGQWYYLNNSGTIVTNSWIANTYYVGSDGVMLKNTSTPDGYEVGSDGKIVKTGKEVKSSTTFDPYIIEEKYCSNIIKKKDGNGNLWVHAQEGSFGVTITFIHIYYTNGNDDVFEKNHDYREGSIVYYKNYNITSASEFNRIYETFEKMK